MQDEEFAYKESETGIKKFKITERTRRKATLSIVHVLIQERSKQCTPGNALIGIKIELFEKAIVENQGERQINKEIRTENPKSLKYLTRNLESEEEDQFVEIMTSKEVVTVVSDGGLKTKGGFRWVASTDEEIIAKCHGELQGSTNQLSLYWLKATEMFLAIKLMSSIAKVIRSEVRISAWSDKQALVKRITKM